MTCASNDSYMGGYSVHCYWIYWIKINSHWMSFTCNCIFLIKFTAVQSTVIWSGYCCIGIFLFFLALLAVQPEPCCNNRIVLFTYTYWMCLNKSFPVIFISQFEPIGRWHSVPAVHMENTHNNTINSNAQQDIYVRIVSNRCANTNFSLGMNEIRKLCQSVVIGKPYKWIASQIRTLTAPSNLTA